MKNVLTEIKLTLATAGTRVAMSSVEIKCFPVSNVCIDFSQTLKQIKSDRIKQKTSSFIFPYDLYLLNGFGV